jgi:hypothetical protein
MIAVVADAGETSVEAVLPEGGSCLQLSCSGWSSVVEVDTVSGSPHSDFTVLDPGQGDGTHGGGLPGAGRGDRKLQTCPGAAHPRTDCRGALLASRTIA